MSGVGVRPTLLTRGLTDRPVFLKDDQRRLEFFSFNRLFFCQRDRFQAMGSRLDIGHGDGLQS